MTMIRLKPCPFCGNYNVSINGMRKYWVSCSKCGCDGPVNNGSLWENKEDAIKAWNKAWMITHKPDKKDFIFPLFMLGVFLELAIPIIGIGLILSR